MTRTEKYAMFGLSASVGLMVMYAVYIGSGYPPVLSNLEVTLLGIVAAFCACVAVLHETEDKRP